MLFFDTALFFLYFVPIGDALTTQNVCGSTPNPKPKTTPTNPLSKKQKLKTHKKTSIVQI